MTMTSGLWFSTASIITSCWSIGSRTCMRRARPTAGCGTSPSPPISLEVSTMITRRDFGQDAGGLAQQGGLAHARAAQDEDALARFDDVLDDVDGAVDGAPDAQRQPDDVPAPVADGGDAVQGALDAGAVVGVEFTDAFDHVGDLLRVDFRIRSGRLRCQHSAPWGRARDR